MEWADAIGFDPQEAIRRLKKAGRPRRAAAAGASRAK
jgi:hypothetical protein